MLDEEIVKRLTRNEIDESKRSLRSRSSTKPLTRNEIDECKRSLRRRSPTISYREGLSKFL